MKGFFVILILGVLASRAFGNCDCTITPFKPPSCSEQCIPKILAQANQWELTAILSYL